MQSPNPTTALQMVMTAIKTRIADVVRNRQPVTDLCNDLHKVIDGLKSTFASDPVSTSLHTEVLDAINECLRLVDHHIEMQALVPPVPETEPDDDFGVTSAHNWATGKPDADKDSH